MAAPEAIRRSLSNYTELREIGEGSFSVVYKGQEREGRQRWVAIKTCFKKQIIRERKVQAITREKAALTRLSTAESSCPLVVALFATMQDPDHLFFVLTLAERGDLLHFMQKHPSGHFSVPQAVFYSAELLSALSHIHSHGILHRDIKPENILLRANGHIFLSDFGVCKDLREPVKAVEENPRVRRRQGNEREKKNGEGESERTEEDDSEEEDEEEFQPRFQRRSSFVGTAQYVTPEVLRGDYATVAVDFWAFGVTLFQLLTGRHAFDDQSEYLMFQRSKKLLYSFPPDFPSEEAKDLIERLLVTEVARRLGSPEMGGVEAVRSHSFFASANAPWDHLLSWDPPHSEVVLPGMAKVIRNRWVFRPHGKWFRYLPRRVDATRQFDYEEAGGSRVHFKRQIEMDHRILQQAASFSSATASLPPSPNKLWLAWLYRDLSREPKWTKNSVEKLFGSEWKVGRMQIFKNTAATNDELWKVKHLIELRPVVFTGGEPSAEDIYSTKISSSGEVRVSRSGDAEWTEKNLRLVDQSKHFTDKELRSHLSSRYFGLKDIFEANVHQPKNVTVIE